jgi:hypothetical protein
MSERDDRPTNLFAEVWEARRGFIEACRLITHSITREPASRNEARDKFVVDRYLDRSIPLKQTLRDVNGTSGWAKVKDETALYRIVQRWYKRHGVPQSDIPKRKQSRT